MSDQHTVNPLGDTNRDKALRREVVVVTDGRLREMREQAIRFEGVGEGTYHWHWVAVMNELIARRAHETTAIPVAWMTDDGRVVNDASKRACGNSSLNSFAIPLYLSAHKPPPAHKHTDECWEPDSGCDMGRNEQHAVRAEPPSDRHPDGRRKGHSPLTAQNLAARIAGAPPSARLYDRDKYPTACLAAEKFIDDYVQGYQVYGEDEHGRDAYYIPNADERQLILDAINGLHADEGFVDLIAVEHAERQARRAAEGRCPTCGGPPGTHLGSRCTATTPGGGK